MSQIRFTIITVCYNAEKYIRETMDSLFGQKFRNYEYLIQDGKSSDKTIELIEKYTEGKTEVQVCSQADQGIYDAMNRALKRARGEYIFFLNAGDCLADDMVLARTSEYIDKCNADIVYGDIIQIENEHRERRRFGNLCKNDLHFLIGSCICHQAMFARRELFAGKNFNTKYEVCADREWLMFQKRNGADLKAMCFPVASVRVEGFSSEHVEELEKETSECLQRYYGNGAWIYKTLLKMKKNEGIARNLRNLERIFFVRRNR